MHIQVFFSITVSPLIIELPAAGHCHFRSPAGARRRHQGAPSTRHATVRPVSLATCQQPTVFSRPAETQPPPCHSSRNETQNLHRVLKYVLSPLSVTPSRSTYTFSFFILFPFSIIHLWKIRRRMLSSLLSINQEAISTMCVAMAPAARAALPPLGGWRCFPSSGKRSRASSRGLGGKATEGLRVWGGSPPD